MFRCVPLCIIAALPVSVGEARAADGLCGARCAHRVLELTNKPADLTDLIEELYDSPEGGTVSFDDLANALRRRGVSCTLVSLGPLDIPSSACPIILHVDGDHFVVLENSGKWSATVWDGLKGEQTVPWWSLRASSSNAMLVCSAVGAPQGQFVDSTFRFVAMGLAVLFLLVGVFLGRKLLRRGPSHTPLASAPSRFAGE